MLKELFKLIRMLGDSRPSDVLLQGMEPVVMKHFPLGGASMMAWCGKLIVKKDVEVILRYLDTPRGQEILQHELGHEYQACYQCNDSHIRYYSSYFWNWLKHIPVVNPKACYYVNMYEVEAYAQEANPAYWSNYYMDDLRKKYDIRGAKKLYKELGNSPKNWKVFIKKL